MSQILKLSVSKTKTFIACKKQFKFNYILKFPSKEMPYHTFGKFLHQVLENFHLAYIQNNSQNPFHIEMKIAYQGALEKYKDKMTIDMKKECHQLIDNYLQIITKDKRNKLSANVLACEKNFSFPITDNVILNGMIDRIQTDQDNILHLADYKSSKSSKYLKDDWFQLLTYAYVMLNEDPSLEKIRVSYIMIRNNFEYLTKEFIAEEIWKVKDKYIDYAKQINEETEYPANPTNLCNYCSFLDKCEEGLAISNPINRVGEVSW